MYGSYNYWRETQRPVRFLFLDARIVVFIGIALLHFRAWTVIMLIVAGASLWLMDKKGLGLAGTFRYFRIKISGPLISARGQHNLRMPVDFGFEGGAYGWHALDEKIFTSGPDNGGMEVEGKENAEDNDFAKST